MSLAEPTTSDTEFLNLLEDTSSDVDEGSISVTWQYVCLDVCYAPDVYKVVYRIKSQGRVAN